MKAPAFPVINFRAILLDFQNLNPKDVGAWPVAPRVTILLALFVGWFVRKSITDGLIFAGIAFVNYLAMRLGKGNASRSLAVFGIIAALLLVVVMASGGNAILWLGLSVGFFNSIMFPNIFTLGVEGLDKGELSMASGLINTLIVGGAVIPVLMGLVADSMGVRFAFILPILCYLYIVFFALVGSKRR